MNGVLKLTLFLLCWQRIGKWLVIMGLAAMALTPLLAYFVEPHFAFGIWIYAFISALVLPCLVAPIAFRYLIGNRRLGLAPGLHLSAGIALLLLTCCLSVAMPVGAALYWPGAVDAFFSIAVFIAASIYSAVLQWALTSRTFAIWLSCAPLVIIILLSQFGPILAPLFLNPPVLLLLFALCVVLWGFGLKMLSGNRYFQPAFCSPVNSTAYLWGGSGWTSKRFASRFYGIVVSPGGTLLQGFPDNWKNRLFFIANLALVTPLVCVVFVSLMRYLDDKPKPFYLASTFMLFSMITSITTSASTGELAARCRLLWLRCGGNRLSQWRTMERLVLHNVLVLNILTALIALGCMLLSDQNRLNPLDYYLTVASCTLLGAYFSLNSRIRQWSLLLQLLMIFILGPGVVWAFFQNTIPLPLLMATVVLVALVFRWFALSAFAHIDWMQVKPATRASVDGRQA